MIILDLRHAGCANVGVRNSSQRDRNQAPSFSYSRTSPLGSVFAAINFFQPPHTRQSVSGINAKRNETKKPSQPASNDKPSPPPSLLRVTLPPNPLHPIHLLLKNPQNLPLQLIRQPDRRRGRPIRGSRLGLLGNVLVAGPAAAHVVVGVVVGADPHGRLRDQVLVGARHLLDALVCDVGGAWRSKTDGLAGFVQGVSAQVVHARHKHKHMAPVRFQGIGLAWC